MRTDPFAEADLTRDAMLGRRVHVFQPREGYRAGTDPVLLAAAVAVIPGQAVLELGCGAAPALCCLGVRVPGLRLAGLELQPGYASLARRNLSENGLAGDIWEGDLAAPPAAMRAERFDAVIANPPYFEARRRVPASDTAREVARAGETSLETWVATASRRLKPRGFATFIQRAERLPELLAALDRHLGALELWPLLPREGRAPRLILARARKEGRAEFRFHAPAVIHAFDSHESCGNRYTDRFEGVFRRGEPLIFPAKLR